MDKPPATTTEAGPAEAAEAVERGAKLIDVRTDEEWEQVRIPGAVHVRLEELAARAAELDSDAELLIYCRSGRRSAMAAEALAGAGYNARNLAGGIKAWIEEGLETEPPEATVS